MEVPLAWLQADDSALLQEIVADVAADRVALVVEVDVHVLAEARRVVVAIRLRVTERLQNWIWLD